MYETVACPTCTRVYLVIIDRPGNCWATETDPQPLNLNVLLMAKPETSGISYATLRKECLDAIRQWPGCETVSGIQLVRQNKGYFSVLITLYGTANEKVANRASRTVQREMRRRFHLTE